MREISPGTQTVVGGGGVALRKVEGLLAEGAEVTVVSPEPNRSLLELSENGEIQLERRPLAGEFRQPVPQDQRIVSEAKYIRHQ